MFQEFMQMGAPAAFVLMAACGAMTVVAVARMIHKDAADARRASLKQLPKPKVVDYD